MCVSVGLNIGLSPQYGSMASINYLGRIQQVEIRTQATNKTTAQLLYVHRRVGKQSSNERRHLSLMPSL